ncbi:MAG: type II toxin-antitoxin system PemK/MazF family toxin [Bdellovibrionia bacterium]
MKIERGDIFLADLDPTRGSEIQKTRPVIVVTNDLANIHSRIITVIPITSQRLDKVFRHELYLGQPKGMDKESKALVDQIRAIDKTRLKQKLSSLTKKQIEDLNNRIALHLGLI